MTSTSTLCWQQLCRLERITDKYPAIPVGLNGGKAPMLKGWQRHPGFGIRELSDFKGIQAVGIRTNPLLCFDFDGISAVNFAKDKGLFPDSLECWRINRDTSQSRFKLIFEPTKQQLMKLPGSEFTGKSITGEREALEIFIHTGRQVIVMGNHVESKGKYFWPDGRGPESLGPPPSKYWDHVIELACSTPIKRSGTSSAVSSNQWIRLDECPICGRNKRQACQIHSDGNTLRCFVGISSYPPKNLSIGSRITNTDWVLSSFQDLGWGEFVNFRKRICNPLMNLRRSLLS